MKRIDGLLVLAIALVIAAHIGLYLVGVSPDVAGQRLAWILAR